MSVVCPYLGNFHFVSYLLPLRTRTHIPVRKATGWQDRTTGWERGGRGYRFDGFTLYQTQWAVVFCDINRGITVEYYTCFYFERNALFDDLRRSYERRRPRFPDNGLAPTLPCWMELALCSLAGLTSQEKFVQFSVFVLSLNFWPCLKEERAPRVAFRHSLTVFFFAAARWPGIKHAGVTGVGGRPRMTEGLFMYLFGSPIAIYSRCNLLKWSAIMSGHPPQRRQANVGSMVLTPQENECLFNCLGRKCIVSFSIKFCHGKLSKNANAANIYCFRSRDGKLAQMLSLFVACDVSGAPFALF